MRFVPIRRVARAQIHSAQILAVTDASVARWARRLRRLSHLPGLIDEMYVRGFENLPLREGPAPILAFSHKKLHDVPAMVMFMAGRPFAHFHDLCYIAQGGLFCGIYAYRDLMPAFAHRHFRRPAAALSRIIGRFTHRLFTELHGYPVFRDGADVPPDQDAYDADRFSGSLVLGMPYEEFAKYAARATRNAVIRVQRDLVEKNRTFVILPEGIYRHDGRIAELQEFLALTAFRKKRAIVPVAIGYDELCPDRWRRITAWADVSPPVDPPVAREACAATTATVRTIFQERTTITASNLIALVLRRRRAEAFRWQDAVDEVQQLAKRTCESGFSADPGLAQERYVSHKLQRFAVTFGKRWLRRECAPGRVALNMEQIQMYADSERTCDDLNWNCNAVVHLSRHLGYEKTPQGRLP